MQWKPCSAHIHSDAHWMNTSPPCPLSHRAPTQYLLLSAEVLSWLQQRFSGFTGFLTISVGESPGKLTSVWSNINYKTWTCSQIFPKLTPPTMEFGMDLWRRLGGQKLPDYSYQNHKDLVIRPFQERGTDWGLFGGLFGFSSQRGCLWLKVRHCGHTHKMHMYKKQRIEQEVNGEFMTKHIKLHSWYICFHCSYGEKI